MSGISINRNQKKDQEIALHEAFAESNAEPGNELSNRAVLPKTARRSNSTLRQKANLQRRNSFAAAPQQQQNTHWHASFETSDLNYHI